jgi:hypothetical protein
MWDDRSKPQRRGYLKRSTKPLKRSWIKRKPKRDREFKGGRIRLANKSSLRRQTYEAAHGKCQHVLPNGRVCGKNAPWDGPWYRRGHLAHKKHGAGRRDDRSSGVYWSCGECHRSYHGGGKVCPPKIICGAAGGGKMEQLRQADYDILVREVGDDDLLAMERDNQTRITTLKEVLGE